MNVDLTPFSRAVQPLGKSLSQLFSEHHFITILCAFFAVMMVISCYKLLRSISPALVGLVLLLVVSMLFLHWTHTRTEPTFLKPAVDVVAPFFPATAPQRIAAAG